MSDVTLREVVQANVRKVCELELAPGQEPYVAPAAFTVAEANYEPGGWLRAIYEDETPVGVTYIEDDEGTPYLVRFMIDAAHQGRGIGRRALALTAATMRAERRASELRTSYTPGPKEPRGFYERLGFVPTGRVHDGEIELSLQL